MPKYAPLEQFLAGQPPATKVVTMSFGQIDMLLVSPLPPSAHRYKAWWLDRSARTTHVQSLAWKRTGWRLDSPDVDLLGQTVTFRR